MMSLKNVNALTHYTDYIIGHVHLGALAWNGGLAFAMLYYIVPRIYGTTLYSNRLANVHFWLATLGILFYAIPMYVAGITQSLMWKEFTAEGVLRYPNFLETVVRHGADVCAAGGGRHVIHRRGGCRRSTTCIAPPGRDRSSRPRKRRRRRFNRTQAVVPTAWHRSLESRPVQFAVLTFVAVLIGGIVEFVPTALVRSNVPTIASVKPYTPLEVEGRDLYIREGCVGCHSQMVRPMRSETARYGDYSKAGEFVYDHPFLWGSKRTGPDLHRIGGKYPDAWHFVHMKQPAATSPGSIMPGLPVAL